MGDQFPSVSDLIQSTQCSFCLSNFSNSSARRLHEIKRHGLIRSDSDKKLDQPQCSSKTSTTTDPSRFFCPHPNCSKVYTSKKIVTQHYVKSHRPKEEECEHCGLKFALKRDRLYHEKKRCPNRSETIATASLRGKKKTKIGENATVIQTGATTVVILQAGSTQSLIDGIVAVLENKEKKDNDRVDEMCQTDDLSPPPLLTQPLIIDSTSQSIQTVQYPPFLETRHVETSIDTDFDDFRHIETQTLPLWNPSPTDYNQYMIFETNP